MRDAEKIEFVLQILNSTVEDAGGSPVAVGRTYAIVADGIAGAYRVEADGLRLPCVWVGGYRGYFSGKGRVANLLVPRAYADGSHAIDSYRILGLLRTQPENSSR